MLINVNFVITVFLNLVLAGSTQAASVLGGTPSMQKLERTQALQISKTLVCVRS